jgi:membrane glycosyltransferase
VTLARLDGGHPHAGIIQGLPLPAGRDTLFARMIQFAARLNGPMLASGLAFWQLEGRQLLGAQRDSAHAYFASLLRPAEASGKGALWAARS